VIKFDNDISRRFADVGRRHDAVLQEFGRCFDRSISRIIFRVGWNVKANAHQLIVVGLDGIRFGKL
jgi:hypothetical protein